MLLVFTVLFGTMYPFFVTVVAQLAFPFQANGSLLTEQGKMVGSLWQGQYFDHPGYFWGRPSARLYQDDLLNAQDISWLGDVKWKDLVLQQRQKFKYGTLPDELESVSASSLDPHISPQALEIQLQRVAQTRHIAVEELRAWVQPFIEQPFLGIWGTPRVNVLRLNLAMDQQWGKP